jgi:hypothetical protein
MCAAINLDDIDDDFLGFAWLNLAPEARALANSPKTFWLFGAGARTNTLSMHRSHLVSLTSPIESARIIYVRRRN